MISINNKYSNMPSFCSSTSMVKNVAAKTSGQVVEHIKGHTVRSLGEDGIELISTFGPDGKFIGQSRFFVDDVGHRHVFTDQNGKVVSDRYLNFLTH